MPKIEVANDCPIVDYPYGLILTDTKNIGKNEIDSEYLLSVQGTFSSDDSTMNVTTFIGGHSDLPYILLLIPNILDGKGWNIVK